MPLGGHQASDDNAGPAVNVISWFLAATAFLTVVLRVITKGILTRLAADDILIFISLALYISATVAAGLQTDNGLGQHIDRIPHQWLVAFQKATYAGDALFVLVLASSKLSVLVFFRMLSPVSVHRKLIMILTWIVSLWAITSFLVAVFQCKMPTVWRILDKETCLNRIGFLASINIVNVLFEIVLISFPIHILAKMQTNLLKKSLLISCFIARILVVGALLSETALQLRSPFGDETWYGWPRAIVRQLASSMSIITACIPYYVSWVPHAFKIYATVRDNSGRKNFKLLPRPTGHIFNNSLRATHLNSLSVDEAARTQGNTESQTNNPMLIRKTTEWLVQSERGSYVVDADEGVSQSIIPDNWYDHPCKRMDGEK